MSVGSVRFLKCEVIVNVSIVAREFLTDYRFVALAVYTISLAALCFGSIAASLRPRGKPEKARAILVME